MFKTILFIGLGILIMCYFKIIKKIVWTLISKREENFNFKKLITGFSFKTSTIIIIILLAVFYFGYYKGQLNTPANFEMSHDKEFFINIPTHSKAFYKPEFSSKAYWIKNDGSKEIVKQGEIKQIQEYLKPYGLMLEPVVVAGYGMSNISSGYEIGAGLRYARLKRWVADLIVTNKGAYPLGLSYRISENSAIGVSVGTGYKEGERGFFERILIKYTVKW